MVEGILEDYAFLWNKASDYLKSQLDLWRSFFSERVHILRRGNTEWPAYKMLLQLAIEHADDSPLTIAAEKWLAEGHCDWLWLRRVPRRLPHAQKNPCLAVLEGHTADVNGALVLSDGRLLSWSDDKTLRLWDEQSGASLAVLKGHTNWVNGALELSDGRLLSWAWDKTLRLWDGHSGVCLAVLEGHTDNINGVLELSDGRLLSWSGTRPCGCGIATAARALAVLEGHTG